MVMPVLMCGFAFAFVGVAMLIASLNFYSRVGNTMLGKFFTNSVFYNTQFVVAYNVEGGIMCKTIKTPYMYMVYIDYTVYLLNMLGNFLTVYVIGCFKQ